MTCPYCGAEVELRDATYVYPNHSKAHKWGKMWVCSRFPECDAYVGCHKGTTIPLGRLANEKLRTFKKEAHRQFDPIWRSGLLSRQEAYKWLAEMLNIPMEECHIGMFDVKMCQKVIELCKHQDNPVIKKYRAKHYVYRKPHPVFSRGYNRNRK